MSDAALLDPPEADAAEVAARLGATEAQIAELWRYRAMLADWNRRLNLVSPGSLAEFWPRHVFDSAQLLDLAPEARVWVDIGAGAGFPGLVLAILLADRPGARVHLVESLGKKCRFLAAVVESLSLPAEVHNARAEELSIAAEVVTARAVAPLERLLGYARPYLARGAIGLFLKGQNAEAEIAAARQRWRFDVAAMPSRSDPTGRILKVERLDRIL
ncbi:MAG TPA: 16S rRNA (guanine(527)-N(7))-methyltransferase RsmG [Caulobacteraceae bacterium]|nr:16S rRNA (guanine(527)-N(7))-methyltransferase RsmG [Caulobacteraceae bacterium]